jgi:hypothetical protein
MAVGEATRHSTREVRKSHYGILETGRILLNRPPMRIFLLGLMRLLYLQIKPVVVSDGVMPEVEWRKIRCRRDQRENLWQDNGNKDDSGKDGPLGVGGGGALKRAAKMLLVKQLKEWKENVVMMQMKKTQKK